MPDVAPDEDERDEMCSFCARTIEQCLFRRVGSGTIARSHRDRVWPFVHPGVGSSLTSGTKIPVEGVDARGADAQAHRVAARFRIPPRVRACLRGGANPAQLGRARPELEARPCQVEGERDKKADSRCL